jgi:hypothetical protein
MPDEVFEQLGTVVDRWCDVESESYGTGTPLSNLWTRTHPMSPPYDPDGIESLLGHIQQNAFFGACHRASLLKYGHFTVGGSIQSFGNLYDFLERCGE